MSTGHYEGQMDRELQVERDLRADLLCAQQV